MPSLLAPQLKKQRLFLLSYRALEHAGTCTQVLEYPTACCTCGSSLSKRPQSTLGLGAPPGLRYKAHWDLWLLSTGKPIEYKSLEQAGTWGYLNPGGAPWHARHLVPQSWGAPWQTEFLFLSVMRVMKPRERWDL